MMGVRECFARKGLAEMDSNRLYERIGELTAVLEAQAQELRRLREAAEAISASMVCLLRDADEREADL